MKGNEFTPEQTVISSISNSVSMMLGRGARAAMREAGKEASHQLWPTLPENVSPEEISRIMHEGVASLAGFGEFKMKPTENVDTNGYEISFKDCAFAEFTEQSGAPCGEQAICFFGFGLVEESIRRMSGAKMQVKLVQHDDATRICHEVAMPRMPTAALAG